MKRTTLITLSLVLVAALILGASPVMAAKPQSVIPLSNGFPSGMHFNLNIHGKDPDVFTCPVNSDSVFIPEYGEAYIKYISDKRSNGYELDVLDPCAMPEPDGNGGTVPGTAEVKIPWQVMTDTGVVNVSGYYVFARIHGKPNNSNDVEGNPSSILLYPNVVAETYNSGTIMNLGLITVKDTYLATPKGFVRFDPDETNKQGKPRGKSKAKDITRLFTWSGWVVWGVSPDYNGDGDINQDDVNDAENDYNLDPLDPDHYYGLVPDLDGGGIDLNEWILFHPDTEGDGDIDEDDTPDMALATAYGLDIWDLDEDGDISVEEWLRYQATLDHATHFTNEWIFNIAEYVATKQKIENDGTKLLQIRFYPIETTTYTLPAQIIVHKAAKPGVDDPHLFNFNISGGPTLDPIDQNFSLTELDPPFTSGGLSSGTYWVEEFVPSGWNLTAVTIVDPDNGSPAWIPGNPVEIDLDTGEEVHIYFTNDESI